eukprot:231533_1
MATNNARSHHEKLLNVGLSMDNKTEDLVNILGGMDNILEHYLSAHNPASLTSVQLKQINDILLDAQPLPVRLQLFIHSSYSIEFTLDLTILILDFVGNIPQNDLILHLDASDYDHCPLKEDSSTIIRWRSLCDNKWFVVTNNNLAPTYHENISNNYGYIHFDGNQILTSNKLYGLFNNDGVTIILVFRPSIKPTGSQQFIFNFGNGYRGRNTNTEIGIDAGNPNKYTGCFGVHSACSNSTVTKTIIEKDKWYLITMIMTVDNVEIFVNGNNKSEDIASNAWTGYNNKNRAPFDIGGRIDGNWIEPSVYQHLRTAGGATYKGDVSVVIVYDRVLIQSERNEIEEPLLHKFINK